jgi:serine/threonine-protein kinase
MAIDSVAALLESIRQNQLLEPGQYPELAAEAKRFNDPRSLAQSLVKKGLLTPYQVNQIFHGQAGNLVMGQYRLLERLGEGGMGQVFKARHHSLGRIVALKVIRKERMDSAESVKRFRREIQAVAQLAHPNVVMAFDADAVGATHFYAMEYVDGIDLSKMIKQQGPLPVATACDYIRQAALGLQHAHERGLVHRDIKPGNLLVTKGDPLNGPPGAPAGKGKRTGGSGPKPLIKILDMGLARLYASDEQNVTTLQLSQAGTVIGTPDFMSPEQGKNSHLVDWRADIYSLGCTFYFLLAGHVPFPGGTNIEKLVRHQMDVPVPVEQLRPDVPVGVRAVLQKMMAKRMEERIQTGGEVAALLAPFCEGNQPAPGAGKKPKRDLPLVVPAAAPLPAAAALEAPSPKSSAFGSIKLLFYDAERRKPRRLGLVVAAVALLGVIGVFLTLLSAFSGSGTPRTGTPGPVASGKPTSLPTATTRPTTPATGSRPVLPTPVRYLPDSANHAWIFRVPEIVKSAMFRQNDAAVRESLAQHTGFLSPLGIDLYNHVDRAVFVMPSTSSQEYFVLLQGTFDQPAFQKAMDYGKPRPRPRKPAKGSLAYYYEMPGGTSLAMINTNTFIYSRDRQLIENVLNRNTSPKALDLNDRDVQRHLDGADDKGSVFVVVGGSTGDGTATLSQAGIRALTCSFRPGDDLQADYVLWASDNSWYQIYQARATEVFQPVLQTFETRLLGAQPGSDVLAAGLNTVPPSFSDRDSTVSFRARYPASDVAKMFKKP